MELQYGFGREIRTFSVPEKNLLCEVTQNPVKAESTGTDAVREALLNPIGTKRLKDMVKPDQKIVIVTSDITRPCPSWLIVPEILKELHEGGADDSRITVVFALGSHRGHTEAENKQLVGEDVYGRITCLDSGADGFVHMGTTAAGTPVDIDRTVASAGSTVAFKTAVLPAGNVSSLWSSFTPVTDTSPTVGCLQAITSAGIEFLRRIPYLFPAFQRICSIFVGTVGNNFSFFYKLRKIIFCTRKL